MTVEQKIKQQELIDKHGFYPRDSVYIESRYIFEELALKAPGRTLYMDQHRAYERAIRSLDFKMNYETISSRRRRDPANPLFPINHLHSLYRHFFSSQKRETIAFQKHEAALLEKIQLMKIYRNFMNSKFVRKNRFDPHAHEKSPAMYVGVADKILSFEEVFGIRKLSSQISLDQREVNFVKRLYSFSRQIIAA